MPSTPPASAWRTTLCPQIFIPSMLAITGLLSLCAINPHLAERFFTTGQGWIGQHLDWFYVLAVAVFLVALVVLALSRLGDIRLGPDDATPEFNYASWIAMLFAAGMGIGLLYFGVAEPMMHFTAPPLAPAGSPAAARDALVTTFFHWGFHAWGIYAVVGLAMAYFGFRYNLPLTLRSALYPMLRERIHGPIGHAVDCFALVGTVFGIATTLGYGVLQLSAGITRLTGWNTSGALTHYLLIAVVISMAGLSAATGVEKGVRRLSEFNLLLAIALMLFVLFAGPTSDILASFSENIGNYLSQIVQLSFRTFAYQPPQQEGWLSGWTILYWAWWISWSPFVGLFIARISRGRTIREFVLGVLCVPTAFNFAWMTIFGNSAIWFDTHRASGALSTAANNVDALLFKFLDLLPFSGITTVVALMLIVVFFVTSADSGALVLDGIATRDRSDSPVWQRLMWAAVLGLTAGVLMHIGGLKALQSMTLIAALPFTIIMLIACVGLWQGLRADRLHATRDLSPATNFWNGQQWRRRLDHLLHQPGREDAQVFISHVVKPALDEIARELQTRGKSARLESFADGALALVVPQEKSRDFVYGVRAQTRTLSRLNPLRTPGTEVAQETVTEPTTFFEDGRAGYDIQYLTMQEVIADALRQYERYVQLAQLHEMQLLMIAPGHTRPA